MNLQREKSIMIRCRMLIKRGWPQPEHGMEYELNWAICEALERWERKPTCQKLINRLRNLQQSWRDWQAFKALNPKSHEGQMSPPAQVNTNEAQQ